MAGAAAAGGLAAWDRPILQAQVAGERPAPAAGVRVINPRGRVPVGLIIDDSTCLVNLNRFAMPQFDAAFAGSNPVYRRDWREWPAEIPDAFVRQFGEWCAGAGVKGKFSIVPYPACVGRLDRMLPGWSRAELADSLKLVREVMMPHWDIHPEMVTHTRVIDLKTGHPYPDDSPRFMENWEWTTGRSVDEIAAYMAYALGILRDAGLACEGVTTPGGFGNRALPQLAQAALQSLRSVFHTEIPHYFRHLFDKGPESVAPRVEYVRGLAGDDPQCVVSIIGCTGDWTGGWDNTTPVGADAFITEDLQRGRLVEVIERGEPALMLAHWTGIFWNGQALGFKIFQQVVQRLKQRFDRLVWMKLSDVARYWAARELTAVRPTPAGFALAAPYACPDFTVELDARVAGATPMPSIEREAHAVPLREVRRATDLVSGAWHQHADRLSICFDLAKGASQLRLRAR